MVVAAMVAGMAVAIQAVDQMEVLMVEVLVTDSNNKEATSDIIKHRYLVRLNDRVKMEWFR